MTGFFLCATQLTPLTTGRDNRSTLDCYRMILPLSPTSAVVVPRPAFSDRRALVFLRGGLTDYVFKVSA